MLFDHPHRRRNNIHNHLPLMATDTAKTADTEITMAKIRSGLQIMKTSTTGKVKAVAMILHVLDVVVVFLVTTGVVR